MSARSQTAAPTTVLHVLACDAAAGTELMTATLAERSPTRGVVSLVALLDRPGVIHRRLRDSGVPVVALGATGTLRSFGRLVRLIRRTRPDVVCGYGFRAGLATRLAAQLLRPRPRTVTGVRGLYVTEIESLDGPRGRVVMGIERATARLVDAYIANSPGAVDVLADHGVGRDRLHVVPNGIDSAPWAPRSRRKPSAGHVLVVLCVGRFTEVKRQTDLVTAAAQLQERGVEAKFVFVGDGPLLPAVRAQAERLRVDDRTDFLGALPRDRVVDLTRTADIACLVSDQEGMPGSVMEAMAAGLPVVGTDVNGIRDLVVDGETGLLVPPRSPALADALAALLTDDAARQRMGDAGNARITAKFSLEAMVAATCDVVIATAIAGRADTIDDR